MSRNYKFHNPSAVYTDHLGNIRLQYAKVAGQLKIMEEDHYYPFGLKHARYNQSQLIFMRKPISDVKTTKMAYTERAYKYKYNGKELQEEFGLNVYDYGWRNYDPAIGRFSKIDRFAEKYHNLSTYSYAGNNPIYYIDVQGDSIVKGYQGKVDVIKKSINTQVTSLTTERDGITTAATNDKGDVSYTKEQQAQVNELNYRIGNLNQSLKDIAAMESDPKNWFKPNAVSEGTIMSFNPSVADVKSKTYTFNYLDGDIAHGIHEFVKHGAQLANGDVSYSLNADGTEVIQTFKSGMTSFDLEVSAYQAQYSYNGYLTGFRTPVSGSKQEKMNTFSKLTGTDDQINTPFNIKKHSLVNVSLIKVMTLSIGKPIY